MRKETGIDIFELIEKWFVFASENKLSGNHTALFFFCVELNNKLSWKPVFGLPTYESAEYIGISPNTFRKCLNDLVDLNMIEMVKKSPNQFTANQVSMKMAYQKLLKLSEGNYQSFVKAQQRQLLNRCTVDRHSDIETSKHINILEEQIKNLQRENELLKSQLSKPKKQVERKDKIEIARDFYRNEIEKMNGEAETKEGKSYVVMISELFSDENENERLTNVLSMNNQISFKSFKLALAKSEALKKEVRNKSNSDTKVKAVGLMHTLRSMDNYAPLTKKNTDAGKTLNNWLLRDIKNI